MGAVVPGLTLVAVLVALALWWLSEPPDSV